MITTFAKFSSATEQQDQTMYLKVEGKKAIGFIKIGHRKLFIRTRTNALVEMTPLCVLDFYVSERCQRGGFGKEIFDAMLEVEQTSAHRLAYDRPSGKLLPFLAKHFGLKSYVPQNNNYVVYDEYFRQGQERPPSGMQGKYAKTQPT